MIHSIRLLPKKTRPDTDDKATRYRGIYWVALEKWRLRITAGWVRGDRNRCAFDRQWIVNADELSDVLELQTAMKETIEALLSPGEVLDPGVSSAPIATFDRGLDEADVCHELGRAFCYTRPEPPLDLFDAPDNQGEGKGKGKGKGEP